MGDARTKGTLAHFKTTRWCDMNKRAINGKWFNPKVHKHYLKHKIKIKLTKDEFYNWCEKNKHLFFEIIKHGGRPSIDRIDPDSHYALDNIAITDLSKNTSLARRHRKPIIATNLKTGKSFTLPGAWCSETTKLGFDPSSIQKICKGRPGHYTYKGHVFRYY